MQLKRFVISVIVCSQWIPVTIHKPFLYHPEERTPTERSTDRGQSFCASIQKPTQNHVKPASFSPIQWNILFNHILSSFPTVFYQFHKTLISSNYCKLHYSIIQKYPLTIFPSSISLCIIFMKKLWKLIQVKNLFNQSQTFNDFLKQLIEK